MNNSRQSVYLSDVPNAGQEATEARANDDDLDGLVLIYAEVPQRKRGGRSVPVGDMRISHGAVV